MNQMRLNVSQRTIDEGTENQWTDLSCDVALFVLIYYLFVALLL